MHFTEPFAVVVVSIECLRRLRILFTYFAGEYRLTRAVRNALKRCDRDKRLNPFINIVNDVFAPALRHRTVQKMAVAVIEILPMYGIGNGRGIMMSDNAS